MAKDTRHFSEWKPGERVMRATAARAFDIAPQTIDAAEKRGFITRGDDKLYDAVELREWHLSKNPLRVGRGKRSQGKPTDAAVEPETKHEDSATGEVLTLNGAKLKSEVYKAKMAELKYMIAAGGLIEISEVESFLISAGKQIQTRMFGWSPRFMTHMTDTGKETVKAEIRELIEEIQEDFQRFASSHGDSETDDQDNGGGDTK